LKSSLDSAGVLLVVLSVLDSKAFGGYIASVLPSGVGVGFLFRGIIKKLNQLSS
jgi:hypothetical protein